MALNGIDISSYQSGLNLNNINYDFVMIKATEGTSYVNPMCDIHYQEAKAAGKKRAVYHFTSFGNAIDEANFFVDNCAGYIRDAIFMLDWEGAGVGNVAWTQSFLGQVEARIGYKPVIYMSEWVENNYDWSPIVDNGLILAKYSDYEIDNNYDMGGAGTAPNTIHWPFYMMWQWTSRGRLNGYAGDLDCDIAYVDAAGWDKYAGVIPTVVLPPVIETPPPVPAPFVVPVEVPTPTVVIPPVEPAVITTTNPPQVMNVITVPGEPKKSKLASGLKLAVAIASLSAVKGYASKLFNPHTGLGRTIRGFLQSAIGIVGFIMLVVSLPSFYDFWISVPTLTSWATPAVVIGIVTAVWNGLGSVINYYNELSSSN